MLAPTYLRDLDVTLDIVTAFCYYRLSPPTGDELIPSKRNVTMSVATTTHLNFRGQARAALEFYGSVFGGSPVLVTNKDFGVPVDPSELDQIKYGQVSSENGFNLLAYDVPLKEDWDRGTRSFFVSLRADTPEEATEYWAKLAKGATIIAPLESAPWAPLYGMLTDRYGIIWVVDVAASY